MQMVENGSFFSPCYRLNDPEDVAKIYSKANLPAFTGITDEDKSHINRARYNLFALLIPVHDRETALQEFLEVSLAWAEQSKHFTALEITKTFLKYEQVNSNEGFLKKYTEESFLYHILNQALRRLKSPMDNFYIRQPFQDLFFAVLELYYQQDPFRKTDFTCYRACTISDEEFDRFSLNIGGFVQMEGFLSSSLKLDVALQHYAQYGNNTLVEIRVNAGNFKGDLDWGFASLRHCSTFKEEDEVLFNPINIFKVYACLERQEKKFSKGNKLEVKRVVVLEFG